MRPPHPAPHSPPEPVPHEPLAAVAPDEPHSLDAEAGAVPVARDAEVHSPSDPLPLQPPDADVHDDPPALGAVADSVPEAQDAEAHSQEDAADEDEPEAQWAAFREALLPSDADLSGDRRPGPNQESAEGRLGTLARWSDANKYGFIQPLDGDSSIFIHRDVFTKARITTPPIGTQLTFGTGWDPAKKKSFVTWCSLPPSTHSTTKQTTPSTRTKNRSKKQS